MSNPPVETEEEEIEAPGPADGTLHRIREALEAKGQVILYGAPGTGKTWLARRFEALHLGGTGRASPAEAAAALLVDLPAWKVVAIGLWIDQEASGWIRGKTAPEIAALPLIRAWFELAPDRAMEPREAVRQAMRFHSAEECAHVNTRRFEPALFWHQEDRGWELWRGAGDAWRDFTEEYGELKRRVATALAGSAPVGVRATLVTFHQSYAYEDFVEGIRPNVGGDEPGAPRYVVRDGAFLTACARAMRHPERKHLFVIDEINRGNVAGVLGELLTLLESTKRARIRRSEADPPLFLARGFVDAEVAAQWTRGDDTAVVTLPSSQREFAVPENLWVIATMNTADRSIALLDAALRRRFAFVEVRPDPDTLSQRGRAWGPAAAEVLRRLNERICWVLGPDQEIGHSYLMDAAAANTEGAFLAALHRAWAGDVVPLLLEHFHGDPKRLRSILGGGWFEQRKRPAGLYDDEDDDGTERLALRDPWLMDPAAVWKLVKKELAIGG